MPGAWGISNTDFAPLRRQCAKGLANALHPLNNFCVLLSADPAAIQSTEAEHLIESRRFAVLSHLFKEAACSVLAKTLVSLCMELPITLKHAEPVPLHE